jgi:ABC-2 type transport system permease protein
MFTRLRAMLIKEFIQTFRDPRMRAVIVVIPIVQVLIFGYAVTTDIRNVATAILDRDGTPESREIVSAFTGSGCFKVAALPSTPEEAENLLDRGKAKAVLRIDPGFGNAVRGDKTGLVQLLVDGTDSNTAAIVLGYASRISADFNLNWSGKRAMRAYGVVPAPALEMRSRAWFNANMDSRNFFVPGVIALLLMVTTLLLSSMAIVREKEMGTIEQILVTPISRMEFIIGKVVPFILIGYLNVILVASVAVFWFEIPIRGSIAAILFATGLYLSSMLGTGLFISTISQTQQQAMMTTFFFTMPFILLSGFIYPIANMPEWIRAVTYLNPLRYFLIILRSVFLKGLGLEVLWPQYAALAVLGALSLTLATLRFRKRMG